jgi:hypothetical protein
MKTELLHRGPGGKQQFYCGHLTVPPHRYLNGSGGALIFGFPLVRRGLIGDGEYVLQYRLGESDGCLKSKCHLMWVGRARLESGRLYLTVF